MVKKHSTPPLICETLTIAKRDLAPGEKIDSLGGFTVYGTIDKAIVASQQNILPLGLSVGAVLKTTVKKSEPVHYDDVDLNEDQTIVHLRRLQDKMSASALKAG